jgi:hypothetical protein
LECGAFVEELTEGGCCSSCGDGLVTELGGAATAEKAQALLAWARREATEEIENRGSVAGALFGFAAGVLVAILTGVSTSALVVLLYTTVLLGLTGRLLAVRAHRALRPHSRLQPTENPLLRRRLIGATAAWGILPVLLLVGLSIFGGRGDLGTIIRRTIGSLWALLGS